MIKKKSFLALLAGLMFFTVPVQAQEKPDSIKLMEKSQDVAVDYLGHAYGLDGWLLKRDGKAQYAYTSPEGGLVLGVLFSPDGEIETAKQLESYRGRKVEGKQAAVKVPKQAKLNSANAFYAAVEKSNWFSVGNENAPYIYVFMNPTCDHCHTYWKNLAPYIQSKTLQVRIIPFGRMEENRVTSAALLSHNNPAKAWTDYLSGNFDILTEKNVKDDGYTKTDANSDLWRKWNLNTPPFTTYRAPTNGEIKVIAGQPKNMLLLLSDFTK